MTMLPFAVYAAAVYAVSTPRQLGKTAALEYERALMPPLKAEPNRSVWCNVRPLAHLLRNHASLHPNPLSPEHRVYWPTLPNL